MTKVLRSKRAGSGAWEEDTNDLIWQKQEQTNEAFCDYEVRPINGEGGFIEHATEALGFDYEHFGLQDVQAVSCTICGGLFKDELWVMRRHRLTCGWLT